MDIQAESTMTLDKNVARLAAAEALFNAVNNSDLESGNNEGGTKNQRALWNKLWKNSKKEQSKWWEAVTLQKYIDCGRIPRGLRIFIIPTHKNPDPEMVVEWMENNHQCSINMLKILVKYAWKDQSRLSDETETIIKDLKELCTAEVFEKEMEKCNEKLRKTEDALKVKKQQKFLQDLKDYERGQILTFGRKKLKLKKWFETKVKDQDESSNKKPSNLEIGDIGLLHTLCELDENIVAEQDPILNLSQMGIEVDERCPSNFKPKSTFSPSVNCDAINVFEKGVIGCLKTLRYMRRSKYDNLSRKHRKAIESLKNDENIVIKKSDKGENIVILSRDDYLKEGLRQLQDKESYSVVDKNEMLIAKKKVFEKLDEWKESGLIEWEEDQFLKVEFPITAAIYFLPKLHKNAKNPPGRPIVSSMGSLLENVSKYVDHFLRPFVEALPSYIKDTREFLRTINGTGWEKDFLLLSLAVDSLYTCIPPEKGIEAVRHCLRARS
ncbi:hypothetical protein NDU88_006462 [Pleurodeles waltl]|uniref:Uncharacterized protein n=1 Tax=Pleurodeles waltl TaxID=8319 RepID=A0AAV7SPX9_PLEWA|nr:hypothetical protein NDU88_006462 [Pleurodeles waltl]